MFSWIPTFSHLFRISFLKKKYFEGLSLALVIHKMVTFASVFASAFFFYYECPFRVSKWQKFSKANKFLVLHRKRFAISAMHLSHIRDTDYVDEIWKSTHVLSIFTKLMILSRTLYVLMVLYCDFCICCFWYCCCHCCRCRRVRRSANGVVSCVHRFCFDFLYWIF